MYTDMWAFPAIRDPFFLGGVDASGVVTVRGILVQREKV